jgi:HSP20 family protein
MANIVRFDPFEEMRALQKQFFDDNFFADAPSAVMPATDVYYTKDGKELVVEANLPNYSDRDIDIGIEDGVLYIQGQKQEKEEDKRQYVVRESSSSFYRRVRLPDQADTSKIEADLENGMLKVVVPLKQLPAPQKIAIGASKKK